ncbi:hypothetical protein NUW54_g13194 [Trametes sanguinea]|uniref:Uncharacterized protein n=1 Tax=Trametes sanguinea TaxID=158606 RepID=A0ACC1MPB2_9APHY|nr:hypothetical protein NUW54_g13194 [Trametes sanguinea]
MNMLINHPHITTTKAATAGVSLSPYVLLEVLEHLSSGRTHRPEDLYMEGPLAADKRHIRGRCLARIELVSRSVSALALDVLWAHVDDFGDLLFRDIVTDADWTRSNLCLFKLSTLARAGAMSSMDYTDYYDSFETNPSTIPAAVDPAVSWSSGKPARPDGPPMLSTIAAFAYSGGNGGYSAQRGYHSQTVVDDLPLPRDMMQGVLVPALQQLTPPVVTLPDEPISIRDFRYIGSYTWRDCPDPTIIALFVNGETLCYPSLYAPTTASACSMKMDTAWALPLR